MSMTMSSRWNIHQFGRGHMIKGVCATVADRADVPVWMPRVAFLVFGVLHWFLAVVLYVVLARVLCPVKRRMAMPRQPDPDFGGVRERFGRLDARLANKDKAFFSEEQKQKTSVRLPRNE